MAKTVIVTGAGTGIGRASVERFSRDGYNVVLNGRRRDKLEAVAETLSGDYLIVAGDVSVDADAARIVEETLDKFGGLDVLVNNAGVAVGGSVGVLSREGWDKQININAGGVFNMITAAIDALKDSRGSIVNVSSVSGIGGDWGLFGYNASKGAVNLLTKSLALDMGKVGVRVNAVAPSLTKTDMTGFVMENEKVMDAFKKRIPMGRYAEPEEVADVIAFLASHDARFVNGVILPVDGGVNASNGQPNLA